MHLDSTHRKQAGQLANSIASRVGVEVRELLLATSAAAAKARGELCTSLIADGWTPMQVDQHFGFAVGTCQRSAIAPPDPEKLATVHSIADAAERRDAKPPRPPNRRGKWLAEASPERKREFALRASEAAKKSGRGFRLTGEKAREAGRVGGLRCGEKRRAKLTSIVRNHSSAAPACVKEEER